MKLFSYLLSVRGLLIAAIVALCCWTSSRYAQHHSAEDPFTTLYMHLIPSVLVEDNHAPLEEQRAVLEVPLPDFTLNLGLFDVPVGALMRAIDYRGSGHMEGGPKTALFNLQIFQIAAIVLCFVCFAGVPAYLRTGKGDPLTKMFAGFAMWVRDEMVYPEMGKELGRKFLPYFLSIFFFILFMNLMGLVPFSATATASIFVTGALAVTTFVAMIACGMAVQGPVAFWKNLVPHVPLPLWPLMFFVELVGLVVKPFALMIRLFANMSGGHMVVLSFMGLIFFFGSLYGSGAGLGASPIAVFFAVFIMIIEAFVAMLQAYIFTQLSIIFVNASVHPEH